MSEAHAAGPDDLVFITETTKAMMIAAKMAEAHRALSGLLGGRFQRVIAVWMKNLSRVMDEEDCSPTEAVVQVIKICGIRSEMEIMALFAACYEMQIRKDAS